MPNLAIRAKAQRLKDVWHGPNSLQKKDVLKYTPENIFKEDSNWYPYK